MCGHSLYMDILNGLTVTGRFSTEEKAKRPQMCYLPFGSGPRNCVGRRFALMEIKIALIELMKKISFVRSPDTEVCATS